MVLPDVEADATPSDNPDQNPAGGSWPTSEPPDSIKINIDPSTLPQPVPLIGRLVGATPTNALRLTALQLREVQQATRRAPTAAETDALVHASSAAMRQQSQYTLAGALAGLAIGRFKRHRFNFPWLPLPLLPRPVADPNTFRVLFGLGPTLRGAPARAAHRAAILSVHACNGTAGGTAIGIFAAITYILNVWMRDPRLAEAKEAQAKQRGQELEQRRKMRGGRPGVPGGGAQPGGYRTLPSSQRPRPSLPPMPAADDASPTGGAEMAEDGFAEYSEPLRGEDAPAKAWDDADRSATGRGDDRSAGPRQRGPSPLPQPRQESLSQSSSDSFFGGDGGGSDAAAPESSRSAGQPVRSDGNSWERLRQKAYQQDGDGSPSGPSLGGNGRLPSQRHRGRQNPADGGKDDGFSFSSEEQDRQLAKDEAQKDFDARVERERRGGDFSDGSRR